MRCWGRVGESDDGLGGGGPGDAGVKLGHCY